MPAPTPYVPFSFEGAEMHRDRVRRQANGDRPHLLKVPLLVVDEDGNIMLNKPETSDTCTAEPPLTLPSFRPERLSRKVRYAKLIRQRLRTHVFRDFDLLAPHNIVMPYGVYKDYSSDTNDEPTIITQLPGYVDLGVAHEDMDIFPNFIKKRGEVVWLGPNDALLELKERREHTANVNVLDSIALLEPLVNASTRLAHRAVQL